jgi:hypothetical protein
VKLAGWVIAAIASVLAVALLWALGRRRGLSPIEAARNEIRAIDAGRAAAANAAKLGTEQARAAVEEAHKATIDALDDRQKAEAHVLQSDPAALARYLTRIGRSGG